MLNKQKRLASNDQVNTITTIITDMRWLVNFKLRKIFALDQIIKSSTMWIFNITRLPLLCSAIEIASYNNTVGFFSLNTFHSEF